MDGNGRWAKKRGLPRIAGHRQGAEAVRTTIRAAVELGVECLTLYAFSSENWRRPEGEINDLQGLMRTYIVRELEEIAREGVRIRLIGDHRAFAPDVVRLLDDAVAKTAANRRLTLVVALNYGSRAEIAAAAARLAAAGRDISEDALDREMQTADLPPLDLLIRTSGEVRLSNFLLWQAAYAELLFTPVLWPDFGRDGLAAACDEFRARERRYGGL